MSIGEGTVECLIRRVRLLNDGGGLSAPVDILIRGGRIAQITAAAEMEPPGAVLKGRRGGEARSPAKGATENSVVIDGHDLLALPGLVNSHFHSSGTFNRGLIGALPLELFMLYELPPFDFGPFGPEMYRVQAMWSGLRMLKAGTTAVMDDVIFYPEVSEETLAGVMEAYDRLGIRATVAVYQPNTVEYTWYPYLKDLLEPELVRRMEQEPRPTTAELLAACERFVARWHGEADGRLRCAVSCSAPQRATDDYLMGLHDFSRARGLPFNVHVYESKLQRVAADVLYNGSAVRHLRALGLLDPLTVVVHAIWVDAADIGDLAGSGCTVVHSPSGNLRCGSGLLPFHLLRRAGIPVALCTDEATVEESCSLWRVGQLAAQLHTIGHPDFRSWPVAAEVLECMTGAGGAALGMPGEIGALEVGSLADLVLLDLGSDVFFPLADPANQLVHGEDGRSVRFVIVGGRLVVDDGVVTTVDEAALREEVAELFPRWLEAVRPAGAWARELGPAFDEMYRRCALADVGVNRWVGDEGVWLGDDEWMREWRETPAGRRPGAR